MGRWRDSVRIICTMHWLHYYSVSNWTEAPRVVHTKSYCQSDSSLITSSPRYFARLHHFYLPVWQSTATYALRSLYFMNSWQRFRKICFKAQAQTITDQYINRSLWNRMHQTVPSVLQQELVDLSLTFRASATRRVQSECFSSSSERVLLVEFRASASRRVLAAW